jgi:hypothetical protein
LLSVIFFAAGALTGWLVARSGETVQRVWPAILRVQIFVTAVALTGVAAWRITGVGQLNGPLLLSVSLLIPFAAAWLARGSRKSGEIALESWSVSANSSYWVVPVAAALAGPAGTMIAALVNVPNTPVDMWWVALMRRDAPRTQRRSTGWFDYSPVIASAVGFALRLVHPAPSSTSEVLTWAGPLLAFSGAALVSGSIYHPHNVTVPRTRASLWRWTWLTSLRVAYCLVIAVFVSSTPLKIVAVLTAFSAPSFSPVQLAVLYGYRSSVVRSAVRWGWVMAPFGVALATYLR